jgi:hypothetical protein
MNTYDILQVVVVALVVVASAWTAFAKLTPRLHNRLMARVGGTLESRRMPLLQHLGHRLNRARPSTSCGGGDSGGCSSCGSCGSGSEGPAVVDQKAEKELHFHR